MKTKKTYSSRRTFVKVAATTAFACNYVPSQVFGANSRINVAGIGVGGKGSSDVMGADKHGAKIVALCDVDLSRGARLIDFFTENDDKVKVYKDFRKMLEEMDKDIDAVTVSTPDHVHAPASLLAMQMGKHCYTQKPLTWSVHEARLMTEVAAKKGVVTQMGNQAHAGEPIRRAVELINAGIIGDVTEAHVMTNRPIWPQGMSSFPVKADIPKHLDWDLWLGPAPKRDFAKGILPFNWRGWWDYGTGALGDMACHTLNMPFMGLDLFDPTSVVAETSGHNKETYPAKCKITFEFPEYKGRPALTMYWYDGGEKPDRDLFPKRSQIKDKNGKEIVADTRAYARLLNTGSLVVGDKGSFFSPGDYGQDARHTGLLSGDKYTLVGDIEQEVEFPESPGHFTELANAIKGGPAPISNFPNYAGPLTETILLGNLAVYADGKKIEWDAKNMVPTNAPEVAHIVRKEYHNGYEI